MAVFSIQYSSYAVPKRLCYDCVLRNSLFTQIGQEDQCTRTLNDIQCFMMSNHISLSMDSNPTPSCFCDPWRKKIVTTDTSTYTDADLAADLNKLTFEERQAMEEDIHGVSDVVHETEELIGSKMKGMIEALAKLTSRERQAWDRAVFLRPALAQDRKLHLMCLRARRFRTLEAAKLLAAYFRTKRDLFGDDLLVHRITWQDLTEKEQQFFCSGVHQLLPNRDRSGRGVAFTRLCQYDLADDNRSTTRCIWYVESAIEDDPVMQQKGVVTVADCNGKWKSSTLQYIQFIAAYPMDATPFHDASLHVLYNDPTMDTMIRTIRRVLRKDHSLRIRLHFGSTLESEYSLRSFGINFSGQLSQSSGPLSMDGIEKDIRKRQRLDEQWRQAEAPYREPSSPIALFPNPQDIIMGRNKMVAVVWAGNIMYHKVIQQFVHRYIEAQAGDRIEKTLIAVEILHVLHNKYRARFLARKETVWEVIDDSEAQKKISQALRMLARDIVCQNGAASSTLPPVSLFNIIED